MKTQKALGINQVNTVFLILEHFFGYSVDTANKAFKYTPAKKDQEAQVVLCFSPLNALIPC